MNWRPTKTFTNYTPWYSARAIKKQGFHEHKCICCCLFFFQQFVNCLIVCLISSSAFLRAQLRFLSISVLPGWTCAKSTPGTARLSDLSAYVTSRACYFDLTTINWPSRFNDTSLCLTCAVEKYCLMKRFISTMRCCALASFRTPMKAA